MGLAYPQRGRIGGDRSNARRRQSDHAWQNTAADLRRVGTRLLHRLPQRACALPRSVLEPGQLELRCKQSEVEKSIPDPGDGGAYALPRSVESAARFAYAWAFSQGARRAIENRGLMADRVGDARPSGMFQTGTRIAAAGGERPPNLYGELRLVSQRES